MTDAILDWDLLLALKELQADGEPDVVARVIETFRTDVPARLARAHAAAERGDCAAMRFEAHSLRGTAGLLGASILYAASTAVERDAEANDLAAARSGLTSVTRALDDVLVALAARPSL